MTHSVALTTFLRAFGRIGLLSFGGPAAQISLMHDELVERHAWMSEQDFLRALSLCMLLPGPEAMQLATYAGWRLRGTLGGLMAGLLFVVPGALIVASLAWGYVTFGQVPLVQAAFVGVKAAVICVVLQALLRMSRKALNTRADWVLAALAFVALFAFGLPFPILIAIAGLWGYLTAKATTPQPPTTRPARGHPLRSLLVWGGLWLAPILALWLTDQAFLTEIALFFSKLAVVTFGGAYAVLAYMTQSVVQDFGWISTREMIDALGLAETTPGPLILVTEFVAFLAGYAQGGLGQALAAAGLALWVTFIPCFLWIFLAGPFIDQLGAKPKLAAALSSITAAVVGVILNLSLWFALHVVFADIHRWGALPLPRLDTISYSALTLTLIAAYLLLRLKIGLLTVLGISAAAAIGLSLF